VSQRRGATSSQATLHTSAIALLPAASHSVVQAVRLLSATCCQAASVHDCGHAAGKAHTPLTLPTASASSTAA
jgi:hypothetical protein